MVIPNPRDPNRVPSVGLDDSVSGMSAPWSGFALGGVEAGVIAVVDGSGAQITSFGGGTQYTDGAVPPAHPIGNTIEWSDGSFWQTVSTAKPLPVTVVTGGGGGTQYVEGATVASATGTVAMGKFGTTIKAILTDTSGNTVVVQGTSPWVINTGSATGAAIPANGFMIGISDGTNLVAVRQASNGLNTTAGGLLAVNNAAQFDDVSPTSITENSFGNLRISANRNLYGTIRDGAGNERGVNVNASNQLSVSADAVIPGTGATNLGKAEDAAHASGDTGVAAWAVRNDNLATTYGADQDYSPFAVDASGRTMVAQKAATATLSNVASSATSVTLLAANAARIGATFTNDSSALLYIKFGTTASTTSYTVVLAGAASAPFSYYEVPAGYTGRIDGIWASATGNARVTEIT